MSNYKIKLLKDRSMKDNIPKKMTVGEKNKLNLLLAGKIRPDSHQGRMLLEKPHVAIAFEQLLDVYGLTDDKLLGRLAKIIRRKATESITNSGAMTTNATSIDANAKEVIKLIWQAQGKFVEKHEFGTPGDFKNASDQDLDKVIDSGMNYLLNRGKTTLDGSTPSIPTG